MTKGTQMRDTLSPAEKLTGPNATVKANRRAKSGCRTCKIRRVKCDEGRPACQRCVSTGRVCDGYGIWGGGGNAYGTSERALNTLVHQLSRPSRHPGTLPGLSQQESHAFHFFRNRTVNKIPGVFGSDFWERLVVQLSLREPAVLHAVIALAATHRRGITPGQVRRPFPTQDSADMAMDPNERLALQQYNKAISYLCHHVEEKDEQSLRITLASCVVFTCIELLKGDIETSQVHFQNGLKLLRELCSRSKSNSTDEHISEAFTRISIRPSIFGQGQEYPDMRTPGNKNWPGSDIPFIFDSMGEARRYLDWLLHDINLLSAEANRLPPTDDLILHQLTKQQERLQASASSWFGTFSSSVPHIRSRCPNGNDALTLGEPLLLLYHGMASIMVATSLRRGDETVFDSYTPEFVAILENTIDLWNKVSAALHKQLGCGRPAEDLSFTADMGFIPPLYYTALKCRVPRFRRRAVDFLVSTPHREGIWDGKLAAAVARKVIELEEGDFYSAAGIIFAEELSPGKLEVPPDDVPLVPGENRLNDVSVLLPKKGTIDDMKATLLCRRHTEEAWETQKVELGLCSDKPCNSA
ncbi:hypothetical protein MFIFM68171_02966 [Madurella fahalii]|uniref:Zn(2)-C6 fungal-type domain-containing protein n=1 Tax=Madurella fahalii TaxID=1157608 RepID=A0ABQ0G4S4_9PEZI